VQYASGFRVDLNKLGSFCRANQILFCVDAIQSIGAEEFDVQKCNADFVVADGHKWMLGPEGLALFYCRSGVRESLSLQQYGWHMIENPTNYNDRHWEIANNARRFECGSPNMLGIVALNASLSLLLEIGMPSVAANVKSNADYLFNQLSADPGIEMLCSSDKKHRTGIINFRSNKVSSDELFTHLTNNNIFCAKRGKGVRLSPHYYTDQVALDKTINLILNH